MADGDLSLIELFERFHDGRRGVVHHSALAQWD